MFAHNAESARGIAPRAAHRSGLEPLDSSGSCHRMKAAAFRQDYALMLSTSATPVFGLAVLEPLLGPTSAGTVGLVALAINLTVPLAVVLPGSPAKSFEAQKVAKNSSSQ
jgi:hypothetical protein